MTFLSTFEESTLLLPKEMLLQLPFPQDALMDLVYTVACLSVKLAWPLQVPPPETE